MVGGWVGVHLALQNRCQNPYNYNLLSSQLVGIHAQTYNIYVNLCLTFMTGRKVDEANSFISLQRDAENVEDGVRTYYIKGSCN